MTRHKPHPKKEVPAQPAPEQARAPSAVEAPAPDPAAPAVQVETPAPAAEAVVELEVVGRLTAEMEELKDRYLRLAAEFDNFRKRAQRERAEAGSRAQAELMRGILDGLDDLGRVAHLNPETTSARDLLAGVELVERKLARELGQGGLERVGVEGEGFDPNVHEAVTSMPAPTAEQDHRIASVLQPGYKFGGMLLRPARVSVYLWREPEPASDSPPGA